MPLAKAKPTSPGRRFVVSVSTPELHKGKPHAALLDVKHRKGGRNNAGRITTRHHGGGHKQHYRRIDFKRDKTDVVAKVERIEYDPNRSAHIALLLFADGERRYILAPKGVKAGDEIRNGSDAPIKPGNAMPMRSIPVGSLVHNIELKLGKGGQLARSAGTYAMIAAKEGKYAQLRLPSGEVRLVLQECCATVGQVGNTDHENIKIGKAGRARWLGWRPKVRGVAMNPIDHPHGGGEGRAGQGNPHPVTPWGKPTKGYKTRKRKHSDKDIVTKRS